MIRHTPDIFYSFLSLSFFPYIFQDTNRSHSSLFPSTLVLSCLPVSTLLFFSTLLYSSLLFSSPLFYLSCRVDLSRWVIPLGRLERDSPLLRLTGYREKIKGAFFIHTPFCSRDTFYVLHYYHFSFPSFD